MNAPIQMRRENIYIYMNTEEEVADIEQVFQDGSLVGIAKAGGIESAIEDAQHWSVVPAFLVVDIRGIDNVLEAIQDLGGAVQNENARTELILLGEKNSIEAYHYYKSMGASDYLAMPVGADEVFESVQRIADERAVHSLNRTRCVSFVGIRGGTGTSSISSAIAEYIVDKHERSCVLIDFDITSGAQSLILQKEPSNALIEMLKNPERIDSVFLSRAISEVRKKLFLLSANNPKERGTFDAEPAQDIIRQCQQGIDMVVCDIPYHSPIDPSIVFASETTFLCTYPTLLGLRDTMAFLGYLQETRFPGKIVILLCKTGEKTGCEVPTESFEANANATVIEIPYDPKSPAQSIRDLEPLYNMNGKMPQALKLVARELPTHEHEEEKTFLEKLKEKLKS